MQPLLVMPISKYYLQTWKGLYQIWPRGLLVIILGMPIINFLPDSLGWFWHIWGMLNRCQTPIFSPFYAKKCFFFWKMMVMKNRPSTPLKWKWWSCEVMSLAFRWLPMTIFFPIVMKRMVMWSHELGISVTSHDHHFHFNGVLGQFFMTIIFKKNTFRHKKG